ncbi:MAG: phosphotransferase family protein [Acidimicrobiia bacterium]|nr:phosphotransferase family protein [Acidimicrobiia bacterium]
MSDLPWRRTAEALEPALCAWARSVGRESSVITDVRVPDNGMSSDSVRFCLDGEELVARLAPAPDAYQTFPTYDLERQRRVMELVRRRTSVPAPEVVHHEESDEWVGVPFIVMRAIEGLVPLDTPNYLMDPESWFRRGTPADWERMEASTLAVLVELHRIGSDEDTAFLRSEAPGATPLACQLAEHRRYYDWARGEHEVPILERAFDVLAATLPDTDRAVLNWGDARPGNIIYRDFEPVGILDWEMAGLGPPEIDVAWATFFQRFWVSMAELAGLPPLPAMFERSSAAATYERLGGDRLEDLAWYEALSGLRFGIILARMSLRSVAFGLQDGVPDDPDDLILFAPLLRQLLDDLQ